MQICLVEDSVPVGEQPATMLGALPGVELAASATGATQAMREILERRPEVVILDLALAGGGGADVLRELRRHAPGIDVYLLSYLSAEPYRQLAARAQARGFFDKAREFQRVRAVVATKAKESLCQASYS